MTQTDHLPMCSQRRDSSSVARRRWVGTLPRIVPTLIASSSSLPRINFDMAPWEDSNNYSLNICFHTSNNYTFEIKIKRTHIFPFSSRLNSFSTTTYLPFTAAVYKTVNFISFMLFIAWGSCYTNVHKQSYSLPGCNVTHVFHK